MGLTRDTTRCSIGNALSAYGRSLRCVNDFTKVSDMEMEEYKQCEEYGGGEATNAKAIINGQGASPATDALISQQRVSRPEHLATI